MKHFLKASDSRMNDLTHFSDSGRARMVDVSDKSSTQRVAIACALAMRPTLLILDEAFSRLTAQASAMLLERLGHWALAQRSLIILFERPPSPFLAWCQQGWRLHDGALSPLC